MTPVRLLFVAAAALLPVSLSAADAATPNYVKTGDPDSGYQMGSLPMTVRQQLQDQLTKAGYTNVTITPSSFYVKATDKTGQPVQMVIGPDSVTMVTEAPAPGGTESQGATTAAPAK